MLGPPDPARKESQGIVPLPQWPVYAERDCLGTIRMPELSLARIILTLAEFTFVLRSIEAVRQLVGRTIAEVECELIIGTLANQRGSRTEAAKLLGISIRTLRNKIHEYDGCGKIVPKPGVH